MEKRLVVVRGYKVEVVKYKHARPMIRSKVKLTADQHKCIIQYLQQEGYFDKESILS